MGLDIKLQSAEKMQPLFTQVIRIMQFCNPLRVRNPYAHSNISSGLLNGNGYYFFYRTISLGETMDLLQLCESVKGAWH